MRSSSGIQVSGDMAFTVAVQCFILMMAAGIFQPETGIVTAQHITAQKNKTYEANHESSTDFGPEMPNNYTNVTDGDFPMGWDRFCIRDERFADWNFTTLDAHSLATMVQISCTLNGDDTLRFLDFRDWSRSQKNKTALKVICRDNSSISLPWPMKAEQLVFIQVEGCIIRDYFEEYFDSSILLIPDEIRVLDLRDLTTLFKISHIDEFIGKASEISRDVDCGPLTAEKLVYRNIDFDMDEDHLDYYIFECLSEGNGFPIADLESSPSSNMSLDESDLFSMLDTDVSDDLEKCLDFDNKIKVLFTKIKKLPHRCIYPHLLHVDESISTVNSADQLRLFQSNSFYPELKLYNLSSVEMRVIPTELGFWRYPDIWPKLEYLDLSNNSISGLNFQKHSSELFKSRIGTINVQNNNFSRLTEKDLDIMQNVATVLLQGNPIDCHCDVVTKLYEFLKNSPDLGVYEYLRDLTCATPQSLYGWKLSELTNDLVYCKPAFPKELVILIIVLSAVILLLAVSFVLVIRYKKEIIILLYTRLHVALPFVDSPSSPVKQCHAYLSYSGKDSKWVVNTLAKMLQGGALGKEFKVYLWEKHHEPGGAIAENIVKGIESSSHTIVVLSKNFLKSEWCLFEFRTALQQCLDERRRHLVFVCLEDIPKAEMDADLRKCVDTLPCIKAGSRIFWDRVVYAIDHEQNKIIDESSSVSSVILQSYVISSSDNIV